MTYKNSVKITINNFSLCWKQLVWMLLSVLIVVGVALAAASPALEMLKNKGFFAAVKDSFETLYSAPKTWPSTVTDCFKMFWQLLSENAHSLWGSYVGAVLSLILLGNIFACVGFYSTSAVLHARMTSNSNAGFTNRLFATLGKSIVYSLVFFIVSLPIFAAIVGLFALYARIAHSAALTLTLLPVVSLVIYVILAIYLSLTCCMIPVMLDGVKNPFKAFAISVKEVSTRFGRTFSSALLLVLTIVFGNLFIGFFTIFAGFLITIPASVVLLSSFGLVTHFAVKNQSFYVSDLCVVNLK